MHIGFHEMISAADAEIQTVSIEAARAMLEDESVQIVDLRDVRELERDGMIPGAFHCPRGMLEFWVHPDSPYHKEAFAQDKTFVFYCGSGWRSALSGKAVQDMGLKKVSHLEGGFSAWKKSGAPVAQREARKPR
ncbi:rhodanese-like domain-containing protein [Algimonas porphyrae]